MKLPRKVYVIVVYDKITKCIPEGVYVGSSANVGQRINQHLNDYSSGTQKVLHDLMRKRFFQVFIVDEIKNIHQSHLEYDWINFFREKTKLDVFNVRINQCGADWHKLKEKEDFKPWLQYATS